MIFTFLIQLTLVFSQPKEHDNDTPKSRNYYLPTPDHCDRLNATEYWRLSLEILRILDHRVSP